MTVYRRAQLHQAAKPTAATTEGAAQNTPPAIPQDDVFDGYVVSEDPWLESDGQVVSEDPWLETLARVALIVACVCLISAFGWRSWSLLCRQQVVVSLVSYILEDELLVSLLYTMALMLGAGGVVIGLLFSVIELMPRAYRFASRFVTQPFKAAKARHADHSATVLEMRRSMEKSNRIMERIELQLLLHKKHLKRLSFQMQSLLESQKSSRAAVANVLA